jgi:hypothetical protein
MASAAQMKVAILFSFYNRPLLAQGFADREIIDAFSIIYIMRITYQADEGLSNA